MDARGFIYEEHRRFFAVVNEGLEELAAAELERLGASDFKPILWHAPHRSGLA